jgi:hypothetical protein
VVCRTDGSWSLRDEIGCYEGGGRFGGGGCGWDGGVTGFGGGGRECEMRVVWDC